MSPIFVRLLVSIFESYLKYVNSWTKTPLSCSFMRLLFQDLITVTPYQFGLPDYVINRLQLIQNSAARLVFCARKHDHVTPLLVNLHWLPIQCIIQFKILMMTFKVLRGEAPSYLCDLITPYVPTRTLRSQNKLLSHQPRFRLKNYGRRAFKTSAPCLWNDLPYNIKKLRHLSPLLSKTCSDLRYPSLLRHTFSASIHLLKFLE